MVILWIWHVRDLRHLDRADALHPGARQVLGCYMWDYGDKRPLPGWRRYSGSAVTGICDLGLESVEWTRRWIAEVGHRELSAPTTDRQGQRAGRDQHGPDFHGLAPAPATYGDTRMGTRWMTLPR